MATTRSVSQELEAIEFRPRSSRGGLWTGGVALGTTLMFLIPIVVAWDEIPLAIIIMLAVLGVAVVSPIAILPFSIPRMRCRVSDHELILEFPPLMRDRIDINSIHSIRQTILRTSPLASFRFPGLAVLDVHYLDAGRVRMCATSASTGILLIEAGRSKYGITPEDSTGLVEMLVERSEREIHLELGAGA